MQTATARSPRRLTASRLGRLEVLAVELRAARLREERAHVAWRAASEPFERVLADWQSRNPKAAPAKFPGIAREVEALAKAATEATEARRAVMLRLEAAALD